MFSVKAIRGGPSSRCATLPAACFPRRTIRGGVCGPPRSLLGTACFPSRRSAAARLPAVLRCARRVSLDGRSAAGSLGAAARRVRCVRAAARRSRGPDAGPRFFFRTARLCGIRCKRIGRAQEDVGKAFFDVAFKAQAENKKPKPSRRTAPFRANARAYDIYIC